MRPLRPVISCRHLATRERPEERYRFYGACEIGDESARTRWVATVDSDWLRAIAGIRQQMEKINRPFIEQIWEAKARQLAARSSGKTDPKADEDVARVADEFLVQSNAFLDEHAEELRRLELPVDAVVGVLSESLDRFVNQKTEGARWEITEEQLAAFSDRVRVFFRPHRSRP